jgi:hypothetical protein
MVNNLPFDETILDTGVTNAVIRNYSSDFDDEEFKWHWDEEDRTIHPIEETDWMFQYDNQLPIQIKGKIEIKKGEWHRIIKGTGDLKLIVEKHKDI